ncbi:MAG: hypothetical protein IPL99_15365 [Candidatus Competibacteraceae bacterium]|nr:hypothetical protein [Candidatus Competibacteraceae bacterium]
MLVLLGGIRDLRAQPEYYGHSMTRIARATSTTASSPRLQKPRLTPAAALDQRWRSYVSSGML